MGVVRPKARPAESGPFAYLGSGHLRPGVIVRVYELAKELGIESKTVMCRVNEAGGAVRSASSVLDPVIEKRVRDLVALSKRDPAERPAPHPAPRRPTPRWPADDFDDEPLPRRTILLDARDVSRRLDIRQGTLRQWVHRGYLARAETRGRRAFYWQHEVLAAQEQTRARQLRVTGSARAWPAEVLREPLTTRQAAIVASVAESTIRMWVHRGHLEPLRRGARPLLFDGQKVLAMSVRARQR